MSVYRSSAGDVTYADDHFRGQRWDRDKFERERERFGRRGPDERDRIRVAERSRSRDGRSVRDIDINIDDMRRGGPRRRYDDLDIHIREENDRRRRPDFFDEPTSAEVANRAMLPYRSRTLVEERDFEEYTPRRRPMRPQYIRRQSSLDTFDRRPPARYMEDHHYRLPADVPIPLPIRRYRSRSRSRSRSRTRSPSRVRERKFEEVIIKGKGSPPREAEEFEEIKVTKKKSRGGSKRSEKIISKPPTVRSASSSSSSSESFEEVKASREEILEDARSVARSEARSAARSVVKEQLREEVIREDTRSEARTVVKEDFKEDITEERGRRGKTRMPRRLCHKSAVIELGYSFEEEDNFIVIQRALDKDRIDEIVEVSKRYYQAEYHQSPEGDLLETKTVIKEKDATYVRASSPARTIASHRSHHHGGHHHHDEQIIDEIGESATIGGPLTMFLPPEHDHRSAAGPRSERDLRREIERLEDERASLKRERFERDRRDDVTVVDESRSVVLREPRRARSRDREEFEFVERVDARSRARSKSRGPATREIVRVEKDRKGRSRSRARSRGRANPNPTLVALAMATLS